MVTLEITSNVFLFFFVIFTFIIFRSAPKTTWAKIPFIMKSFFHFFKEISKEKVIS